MRALVFFAAIALATSATARLPDPFFRCEFGKSGHELSFRCLDASGTFRNTSETDPRAALQKAGEAIIKSEWHHYTSSRFEHTTVDVGGAKTPAIRVFTTVNKGDGSTSESLRVAITRSARISLASCEGAGCLPLIEGFAKHGPPAPAAALLRGAPVTAVDIPRFGLGTGTSFAGTVTVAGVKLAPAPGCYVNPGIVGFVSCEEPPLCRADGDCTGARVSWEHWTRELAPTDFTPWIRHAWKDRHEAPTIEQRVGGCRIAGKPGKCRQFVAHGRSVRYTETVGTTPIEPSGFLSVRCFSPVTVELPPLCRQLIDAFEPDAK